MRAEGYYWVKYEGRWEIAHYRRDGKKDFEGKDMYFWTLPTIIDESWWHSDSDFEEIDERRIERELPAFKCMVSDCQNPNNGKSALCEDHYKEAIDDLSPIEPIDK